VKRHITEVVLSDFKVIAFNKRDEQAEARTAA